MTDTLDLIHRELDESLQYQLSLIELNADLAGERLDDMVDEGNRRQLERMLDFHNPFRREFRERYGRDLIIDCGVRTYAEQKRLYDRWRDSKGIAFVVPGQQSHHRPGPSMAIDMHETFWRDRRPGEPWHFEYDSAAYPADDRTWFEKARDRFASWNLKRHMRKAGML